MCGCKNIGSMRKSRRVAKVTPTDLAAMIGGGVASQLVNGPIRSIVQKAMPGKEDLVAKAVPVIKAAAGGYVAYTSKNKTVRNVALGFTAVAGVEVAQQFVPQLTTISGTSGSLYEIGSSETGALIRIPLDSGQSYAGPVLGEDDLIAGSIPSTNALEAL